MVVLLIYLHRVFELIQKFIFIFDLTQVSDRRIAYFYNVWKLLIPGSIILLNHFLEIRINRLQKVLLHRLVPLFFLFWLVQKIHLSLTLCASLLSVNGRIHCSFSSKARSVCRNQILKSWWKTFFILKNGPIFGWGYLILFKIFQFRSQKYLLHLRLGRKHRFLVLVDDGALSFLGRVDRHEGIYTKLWFGLVKVFLHHQVESLRRCLWRNPLLYAEDHCLFFWGIDLLHHGRVHSGISI